MDAFPAQDSLLPHGDHVKTRRVVRRRKQKKEESLITALCSWIVEHQIGLAINLVLLLSLTHICFPRARPHTRKFFEMAYYNPDTQAYTRGIDDMYLVFFWIVAFTGLRMGSMEYLLQPFAQWGGIESKKARTRFAEQGWMVMYDSVFWSLGMYLMYKSDYWFNLKALWEGYPPIHMSGTMKWYYLVQFAFWLQQLFVVNIEERRKDFWQMFTHHIFTCALLFASYGWYQHKVGNVILCTMDVVDILLPLAKMFNYLGLRTLCDVTFGIFITVWFVTRHIFYPLVCRAIYVDLPVLGCYDSITGAKIEGEENTSIWSNISQPFTRPGGHVCFNDNIRLLFLGMLLALQVLMILWFVMISRLACSVIMGKVAEDPRSDDEGEDSYEEFEIDDHFDAEWDEEHAIEEEVGVEGLSARPKGGPSGRRGKRPVARTSAISIPGHGDHKELLGRIGCDKPS
ncbi:longevity assurance proteins LAG1/LAC1 [Trichodelitschia bisporula]|uniref:Longevity assurance proteins LAG1/LAC1 n=1 Tax=Trichodelitschia bisporula TaxID=703511 RepID=A0A6G1HQB3_9PEZI|nr:longevity assurance proteins LAG1/LAC1 [Trichodelitschia bisporula]